MVGKTAGAIAALILLIVTGYVLWTARRQAADTRAFAFASVSVLSVVAVSMPAMAAAHNQILMIPAVLLLFKRYRSLANFCECYCCLYRSGSRSRSLWGFLAQDWESPSKSFLELRRRP
jgi:hypothetical protein